MKDLEGGKGGGLRAVGMRREEKGGGRGKGEGGKEPEIKKGGEGGKGKGERNQQFKTGVSRHGH